MVHRPNETEEAPGGNPRVQNHLNTTSPESRESLTHPSMGLRDRHLSLLGCPFGGVRREGGGCVVPYSPSGTSRRTGGAGVDEAKGDVKIPGTPPSKLRVLSETVVDVWAVEGLSFYISPPPSLVETSDVFRTETGEGKRKNLTTGSIQLSSIPGRNVPFCVEEPCESRRPKSRKIMVERFRKDQSRIETLLFTQ